MSFRFFPSLKKWPMAVQEALSKAYKSDTSGVIRQISFSAGRPRCGKVPVTVAVDSHRAFFSEVSDTYPVLDDLRDWMERCLTYDRNGTFHPEAVTIELADSVYSLVLFQVGWEENKRDDPVPVSVFIIMRHGVGFPILFAFCHPVETLRRLYNTIQSCLNKNRRFFDDPRYWYNVKRFDRLKPESITDRLLRRIKSQKIELHCRNYHTGNHY